MEIDEFHEAAFRRMGDGLRIQWKRNSAVHARRTKQKKDIDLIDGGTSLRVIIKRNWICGGCE
jgi:hypothetical protein